MPIIFSTFLEKVFRKQGGGAVLFLWPINFSPFGIKRQKRRKLEVFFKERYECKYMSKAKDI
jgi:hypothetical protein